jgi:hypothetical protein
MNIYSYIVEEYKRKQTVKTDDTKAMESLKWSTAELKQVGIGFLQFMFDVHPNSSAKGGNIDVLIFLLPLKSYEDLCDHIHMNVFAII